MAVEGLYRVNGGPPVPVAELDWGKVSIWDLVEQKVVGAPWSPVLSWPPYMLAEDPEALARKNGDPQNRYPLKEPVWPPR